MARVHSYAYETHPGYEPAPYPDSHTTLDANGNPQPVKRRKKKKNMAGPYGEVRGTGGAMANRPSPEFEASRASTLAEIDADLKQTTDRILEMIKGLSA